MARTRRNEEAVHKERTTLGFDKVFAQYDHKIGGSTKYEERTVAKKHKSVVNAKEEQVAIITSAQQIGWRPQIDDLRLGLNLKANCNRNFYDRGHL